MDGLLYFLLSMVFFKNAGGTPLTIQLRKANTLKRENVHFFVLGVLKNS